MVSDLVLLRDLPNFIRESVRGYVGCVSGAIKKDEYLQKMESAGFQDVRIMNEKSFPIEFIVNDPAAKEIIEKAGIPREKVRRLRIQSLASRFTEPDRPSKESHHRIDSFIVCSALPHHS